MLCRTPLCNVYTLKQDKLIYRKINNKSLHRKIPPKKKKNKKRTVACKNFFQLVRKFLLEHPETSPLVVRYQ